MWGGDILCELWVCTFCGYFHGPLACLEVSGEAGGWWANDDFTLG